MISKRILLVFVISLFLIANVQRSSAIDYGLLGDYLSSNGERYNFNKFVGKPVIIDATATWCSPCKDQIDNLKAVFTEHSEDIKILTLSVSPLTDSMQDMGDLQSDTGAKWEFGVDTSNEFMDRMRTPLLPTLYFLDEFGHLIEEWVGLTPTEVIDNAVVEYLQHGKLISDHSTFNIPLTGIIPIALTLGVLSALSPCLFPLFPNYVAVSVKRNPSFLASLTSAFLVTLGILTVLMIFAKVASYTLASFLVRNYLYFAITQAAIIIISGLLLMFNPSFLYKIKLPQSIESWIFSEEALNNYFILSYVLGLLFTIIAAPCASGYFLSVISLTITQSFVQQLIVLTSYSIGAGFPFLIFSVFNVKLKGQTIGKIHFFNKKGSLILGFILVIAGIWILTTVY
jgi:cytochrome c-type biogenesis protein